MIPISTRTKEAIKTGLAMAISFGIAMQLGWDKPFWAGFAVAMISMSTAGQSLNKGAMRMLGTLVGLAAALTLLAFFSQDRWAFLVVLSVYVGFCTYMLTGKNLVYFWFVSAFVCILIAIEGGSNSQNAFYTALLRAQETGLGILVYALVSVFLWPQSSAARLNDVSRKLFITQVKLYRAYRGLMTEESAGEEYRALRLQEMQLLNQFVQTLNGAQTDTYQVWEVRHQWQRFYAQSTVLMETLERWRESFAGNRHLNLNRLLPNLESVSLEIDRRLEQIVRMLTGKEPIGAPRQIGLTIDPESLHDLTHFQKAAVTVTKAQIDDLERISRRLFNYVADIKGFSSHSRIPRRTKVRTLGPDLDPDRLAAALRVVITLWCAFILWVYVNPPGHAMFVFLATLFAMISAMLRLNISLMFLPFVYGSAVAGILYVFVMPQLSGYTQLGLMMFGVTFGYYYLFWQPRQQLIKMAGMVAFLVLTSVQNEQVYSFAAYANSTAMILLACALAVATSYFPASPQPEKVFLRLQARFFRHSEFLMARMALDWKQTNGWAGRLKLMLYHNDILELPQKLGVWGNMIDHRLFPANTPEQVQTLANSLQALAFRLKDLVEARRQPQASLLVRELLDDVRAWRLAIEDLFQKWAGNPAAAESDLQDRLAARLTKMETHIDRTLSLTEQAELSEEDYKNFYRLIGSFRGLSESVVAHARLAGGIDWGQWKEARF